ncbi:MAG: hypothetical protein V4459_08845 [Pseudomonadota bacterium]
MTSYLIFFLILLGINMMPAFGPPTWSVIVLYGLNSQLHLAALIPLAAAAAALGRLALAYAFRFIGDRLPEKRRRGLAAARTAIEKRKRGAFIALALFALSPVPSAQLFEAAGLMKVRLLAFTAAFFAGRIVSYTIYATSARGLQATSLGDTFGNGLKSPWGIGIQIIAIVALVGLARIDWVKRLNFEPTSKRS